MYYWSISRPLVLTQNTRMFIVFTRIVVVQMNIIRACRWIIIAAKVIPSFMAYLIIICNNKSLSFISACLLLKSAPIHERVALVRWPGPIFNTFSRSKSTSRVLDRGDYVLIKLLAVYVCMPAGPPNQMTYEYRGFFQRRE